MERCSTRETWAVSVTLDPTSAALIQVGKLTKIDNVHLKDISASTATPPPDTFDTRPAVGFHGLADRRCYRPNIAPPNPSLTFHYPVGTSPGQYVFTKVVQFSPSGEAVIDNSNYAMATVSEIGLQPTHGTTVDTNSTNLVAIQFTGLGGKRQNLQKMKLFGHRLRAFSLVEVTLALGVAAFCLIAVFGLMPVGVQTNRNATSQTGAPQT